MRLIGVLGGTFNPIHYGHLRMAQALVNSMDLAEVRFVPSAVPPHKPMPAVSAQQRATMVRLAIQDNPRFSLDCSELERSGPSYTIDTLELLRAQFDQQTAICLIMGADAFRTLHSWHRWQAIISNCHIILVQRPLIAPQENLAAPLATLLAEHYTEHTADFHHHTAGCISMQPIETQEISATGIRNLLAQQQSPKYLLPDAVLAYIDQLGLYR